ncbi:hypothetical protein [Streptomyces spongiae]|uniref:Uncharacterized protein n=1 Tax=Streptomyces spongiae TaxID=565072 RepID=A0A5N8X8T5_9ACTN|nr:hypothetical protein [Streptomyces spongiae]MPY55910.1 hypothetical protein [Streptomyces spongiae]
MEGTGGYQLGSQGVALTNNWATMSNYLRSRLQDGRAVDYWLGGRHYTTLQSIASSLAVAYMAVWWQYKAP